MKTRPFFKNQIASLDNGHAHLFGEVAVLEVALLYTPGVSTTMFDQ